MRTIALALVTLLAAACASGADDDVAPRESARDRLDENARFALSRATDIGFLASIDRGDKVLTEEVDLDLLMGEVYVTAGYDGDLSVDLLDLYFDDVVAGEKVITRDGLHLTGIRVALRAPTACHQTEWAVDDDSCFALATTDIDFEWSLEVNGVDYGLGTQHVDGIKLSIALTSSPEGDLSLDVAGSAIGTFWSWAGIVEFSNLDVMLHGTQMPVVW